MSRLKRAVSFDDVMLMPHHSTLHTRADADLHTRIASVDLKIPIIAANMSSVCEDQMAIAMGEMGGLGIIHRMSSIEDQDQFLFRTVAYGPDFKSIRVGFSIGIGDDWHKRMEQCMNRADIVCLDIAHADHERVLELLKKYYGAYKNYPIIIGQIATASAVKRLLTVIPEKYYETTAFKASIGGGSLCTTRIKTGFGVPTLQAIMDISAEGIREKGITLIADGGIKNSGDIVKALAAGADAVMLGNLLAGTDEAPGDIVDGEGNKQYHPNGKKFKMYRGSASMSDKALRNEKTKHIEGEETLVPYKGSVTKVVNDLLDGIRSGMSYSGSHTISELQEDAEFIEITAAGFRESVPHGKA